MSLGIMMSKLQEWLIQTGRQHAKRILAAAVILGLFFMAQLPALSGQEKAALASKFAFSRISLSSLSMEASKQERSVHPALARHSAWISAVGAAVALNDLDGDGLPNDVCQVETRTDQILVSPIPGSGQRYQPFALPTPKGGYRPDTVAPMGCVPHDMNEDGLMDVLVYYWGRTPVAFLRRSASSLNAESYVAQTIADGKGSEQWFTNATTFADVDGDGHSDLIVGNYFADNSEILNASAANTPEMQDSMSEAFNGGVNHILLWTGARTGAAPSVTYEDIPGVFADPIARAWTLAIGAADLDGDLLPELYFANDFGPDRLLHNRSQPGKVRLTVLSGEKTIGMPNSKVVGRDSFKGMGVDFADLNQDGWLDIYVSNIADEYALEESHFLFLSTAQPEKMRKGIAPYRDHSESLGLARSSWGWDTKFGDFDNDGVVEALQATGFRKGQVNRWPELQELAIANDRALRHAGSWFAFHPGDDLSGHDPNAFFVKAKNGRYYDLSKELGLADPCVTRGIATADVDGDGDLDFAIANQWEDSFFYRNDSPHPGKFLGLRLQHPEGSAVVGAVATVTSAPGSVQIAQVDGGNGHSGVRSSELHFGLGDVPDDTAVGVHLEWRDRSGQPQHSDLELSPGWHDLQLNTTSREVGSS
jgi:hypothetical protein